MKNLETIKSNTPDIIKEKLKLVLDKVMDKCSENEIKEYLLDFKEQFKTMGLQEKGVITSANNIEKFNLGNGENKKGTPGHIKGCIFYNHLLDVNGLKYHKRINSGEKCVVVKLKSNIYNKDVISIPLSGVLPEEFNLTDKIDVDGMFEKVFLSPLRNITMVLGWNLKDLNIAQM